MNRMASAFLTRLTVSTLRIGVPTRTTLQTYEAAMSISRRILHSRVPRLLGALDRLDPGHQAHGKSPATAFVAVPLVMRDTQFRGRARAARSGSSTT